MPTAQTTAVIAMKGFPGTILLLKFLCFERFVNRNNAYFCAVCYNINVSV